MDSRSNLACLHLFSPKDFIIHFTERSLVVKEQNVMISTTSSAVRSSNANKNLTVPADNSDKT